MSDGIALKCDHKTAPVSVEIRVGWAETATDDEVIETLALVYANAVHRAMQRRAL